MMMQMVGRIIMMRQNEDQIMVYLLLSVASHLPLYKCRINTVV